MNESYVYEVEVKTHQAEYFLGVIESLLDREGFETKIHLHEPPHQMEIIEFVRGDDNLSVQIDRMEMDRCSLRICSEEVDTHSLVLTVIRTLCADLIATFLKPIAGEVDSGKVEVNIGKDLDEIVSSSSKE